jgi:hypothetical protein
MTSEIESKEEKKRKDMTSIFFILTMKNVKVLFIEGEEGTKE